VPGSGAAEIIVARIDAGGTGEATMVQDDTIDITRLIDDRKMSAFNAQLVILSFFVALFDGYDIIAAAVALPQLKAAWNITDMRPVGWMLSASLVGILFGAPIYGYVGDRFGRKKAIIGSCLTFGAFTLAAAASGSVMQLLILRFFAGIGIGGIFPNIIALNAEFAPKRVRATMIILMFTGVTFGGVLPGLISVWFVGTYGWQILFVVGGVLPIVMGAVVQLWLPESIKFLVLKTQDREAAAGLVRRLAPGLEIGPRAHFVIRDEAVFPDFHIQYLFAGALRFLTPLLWILFICNQMAFYFSNSWMPTVLGTAGVSGSSAQIATSLFQLGGTVGGLLLSMPLNRQGLMPVALLFAASLPIVGSIGFLTGYVPLLMLIVFLAGFCLLGLQFGLNATSAMLYPTSIRSNGSGWAFGVGRFGSISGPVIGGYLIAAQLPLHQIFLLLLIPLAIGTVASFVMAKLHSASLAGAAGGTEARVPAGD
jgi:AAHS family 4-hydroxybenzoate transporter-like MFS transporter